MSQPDRHEADKSTDKMQASMQAHAAARSFKKRSAKAGGAFLTIREVADELGVQQHVLRFWETKFSQVKPMKRGGGRRYYRPDDVILLKNIQHLLYTEGYTIKGVQKLLRSEGKKALSQSLLAEQENAEAQAEDVVNEISASEETVLTQPQQDKAVSYKTLSDNQQEALHAMLDELKALREFISSQ